jgi:hypothetical protein
MIPLAIGVAILDDHASLTHLETGASFLAALGAAVDRLIVGIVHYTYLWYSLGGMIE